MKTKLTHRILLGIVAVVLGCTLVILSMATLVAADPGTPTVDGVVDDVYYTDGQVIYFANATYTTMINTLYVLDDDSQDVYFAYVVSPDFVDNTYGTNTVGQYRNPKGKPSGHGFKDLKSSDMQSFVITDTCGTKVLDFGIDLISDGTQTSRPSYHGTLTVTAGVGDGFITPPGNPLSLTVDTSLDYNLNDTGYCSGGNCSLSSTGTDLLTDSPATDISYTVNTEYPLWQYEIIYEVRVDRAVFGEGCDLGDIDPVEIHASPSKIGDHDITVDKLGSIGDFVWDDGPSHNGIQDGTEPTAGGLNDIHVYLYQDTNGDHVLDGGDVLTRTTTTQNAPGTNKPGWYLFTALPAGNYIVKVDDTDVGNYGFIPTGEEVDGDDTIDSNGPASAPYTETVTLAAEEQNLTIDFGYWSGSTAVTLSSFAARSNAGGSANWLWLGLVSLTVIAGGSLFWAKRRAG